MAYQQQDFGGSRRRPRNAQQEADYVPRKKARGQRPVDIFSSGIHYLKRKPYMNSTGSDAAHTNVSFADLHVPPHEYYARSLLPAHATPFAPATALCTQWVHTTQYPDARQFQPQQRVARRVATNAMQWSPNGRRLLCGTSNGDFVVLNGQAFGAELKTTAHEDGKAVRGLAWGRQNNAVLSCDEAGVVKLWANNFSLAAAFDSSQRGLRDICWSPLGERKFATAGQDGCVRIWDAETLVSSSSSSASAPSDANGSPSSVKVSAGGASANSQQQQQQHELKLEGHGGDVISVAWHPWKSLIASGSQDRDCRLWDPRIGGASSANDGTGGSASTTTTGQRNLAVLSGHTDSVASVKWHPNGRDWQLLSCGRDATIRLWDARTMRELACFSGHQKSVNAVAWHPTHPDFFTSCGGDGLLAFWSTQGANTTQSMVAQEAQRMQSESGLAATSAAASSLLLAPKKITRFVASVPAAHDRFRDEPHQINCLAWSPFAHVLATGSGEVNFWARNKPGAMEEVRYENEDVADVVMPSAVSAALGSGWA